MNRLWSAAAVVFVLLGVGCSSGGDDGPRMRAVSQTPSFETKVVRTSDSLRVVFDDSVDKASATPGSFSIVPLVGGAGVPGAISFAKTTLPDDTIVFKPSAPWEWGRRYQVRLSHGLQSAVGHPVSVELPSKGIFVANIPNDFELTTYNPRDPFGMFMATLDRMGFDPLAPESDVEPWHIPGANVTGAWKYSIGRGDVVIAIVDNGMEDYGKPELRRQFFLNRGELPLPHANGSPCPDYDCNGDGRFDVDDYAQDERVSGSTPHSAMDLIRAFSNGVDDDGNGFPDDISGWDFLRWGNQPMGDKRLPEGVHGAGRAEMAAAQGNNGEGKNPGICSECRILPVRTSAGLVYEYNRMAAGIRYATSFGASVITFAGVNFTYSEEAHRAVRDAFDAGALTVAASGDELTFHHWLPAAGEDAMAIKSLYSLPPVNLLGQIDLSQIGFMEGFCTNYGSQTQLAVPTTTGCSSDGVANSAGMLGLLISRAKDLGIDLEADEAREILTMTATDIQDHCISVSEFGQVCREGFEEHFAYGRPELEMALRALGDPELGIGPRIPPSIRVTAPKWWQTFDPRVTPTVSVEGRIHSRVWPVEWEVQIAEGQDPLGSDFHAVAGGKARSDVEGVIADVPIAEIFPESWASRTADKTHAFDVTLRVQARYEPRHAAAGETVLGEYRKTFSVHTDDDPKTGLVAGFPMDLGESGESAPVLYDLDGDVDRRLEIVFGTGGGRVEALKYDAAAGAWRSMTGFPVDLTGSFPAVKDSIFASLAIGDLFGDGRAEIVVATTSGLVYAFDPMAAASGENALLPGFPVAADVPDASSPIAFGFGNGFLASPVLVDLDRDGVLEIVAASQDEKAYAWKPAPRGGNAGVQRLPGWPVAARSLPGLVSADKICEGEDFASPIVGTPAAGLLDPSSGDPAIRDFPSVVVATNEACDDGTSRVYAIFHDGMAHPGGPFLPGWPAKTPNPIGGFVPLAYIMGTVSSPAVAVTETGTHIGVGTSVWLPLLIEYAGGEVQTKGLPVDLSINTMASPSFSSLRMDDKLQYVMPMTGGFKKTETGTKLLNSKILAFDLDPPNTPRLRGALDDVAMLSSATVADLDNDGNREVISGSGGYLVHTFNASGTEPRGWPKYTQKWVMTPPTVGDMDADGKLEVVVHTREGVLYAWESEGVACPSGKPSSDWWRFHHDERNTGFNGADTLPPSRIVDLAAAPGADGKLDLRFTAPGDDWGCGRARSYEVRYATDGSVDLSDPAKFAAASLAAEVPSPASGGAAETFAVVAPGAARIAVRARDDAGNVSLASNVASVAASGIGP